MKIQRKQLQPFTNIVIVLKLMLKRKKQKSYDKNIWKLLVKPKRLADETLKAKGRQ